MHIYAPFCIYLPPVFISFYVFLVVNILKFGLFIFYCGTLGTARFLCIFQVIGARSECGVARKHKGNLGSGLAQLMWKIWSLKHLKWVQESWRAPISWRGGADSLNRGGTSEGGSKPGRNKGMMHRVSNSWRDKGSDAVTRGGCP